MRALRPTSPAELLAIVLCPARTFGAEADAVVALRRIKRAIIRRYRAERRS